MKDEIIKSKSRRRVLAEAIRAGLLAMIGIGSVSMVVKKRRLVARGVCINKSICSKCQGFDICSLPAALSAKKAKGIS